MLKILNASPGFGAPLTEQEIKDFLTTKVLMLHLGTVDENENGSDNNDIDQSNDQEIDDVKKGSSAENDAENSVSLD
jgi:hypothetical protein